MEAIQEVGGHTYLVDGTKLLAYVKNGSIKAEYFSQPLRFDRRGRKFVRVQSEMFKKPKTDTRVQVQGSKGSVYYVDLAEQTCTCPGFTYHGNCKHLKSVNEQH